MRLNPWTYETPPPHTWSHSCTYSNNHTWCSDLQETLRWFRSERRLRSNMTSTPAIYAYIYRRHATKHLRVTFVLLILFRRYSYELLVRIHYQKWKIQTQMCEYWLANHLIGFLIVLIAYKHYMLISKWLNFFQRKYE